MLNLLSLRLQPGFLLRTLAWLLLLNFGLASANAASLFKATAPAIAPELSTARDSPVVRSRPVELDLGLLAAEADLPAGALVQKKGLSLNLFDDVSFIADADRIEESPQGLIWVGTLRGVEQSQVVIAVTGDVVAGNISLPDGRYHIRYLGHAVHEVQKIDPSLFPEDEPPIPAPDFSARSRFIGVLFSASSFRSSALSLPPSDLTPRPALSTKITVHFT